MSSPQTLWQLPSYGRARGGRQHTDKRKEQKTPFHHNETWRNTRCPDDCQRLGTLMVGHIEDFCFAVRVRPVHIDTLWLRAAAQKPAAVQAPRETTSRDGGGWGRFECPRTWCRQRCRGRCGDAGGDQWSPERCVGSLRIFTLIGGPAKFSRERTEQWRARPPKPAVLLHLRGGRRPRQGVPVYG